MHLAFHKTSIFSAYFQPSAFSLRYVYLSNWEPVELFGIRKINLFRMCDKGGVGLNYISIVYESFESLYQVRITRAASL